MKKFALSVLSIAILTSAAMAPAGTAMAQWRDGPPPRWDDRRGPPPPRWDRDRDRHHRHHDNTGKVIAGGLAAGIVGGLIGERGAAERGHASSILLSLSEELC